MKIKFHTIYTTLFACLLGVTLTFAFAPHNIFPLAILVPTGLLALWFGVTPKRAFWLGFVFGVGFYGAGVYWIFHSIHVFGGVPILPAGLITSLFIVALALFPAIVGFLLNRYFPINNATRVICAFPAIWVVSEWVRSWIFTGFPWLFVGYSQTLSPL